MTIDVNDKILYLGAGCAIGLAIGMLFAPQSGEETRRDLTNKVDHATQKWHDTMEKSRNVTSIARQRMEHGPIAARPEFLEEEK